MRVTISVTATMLNHLVPPPLLAELEVSTYELRTIAEKPENPPLQYVAGDDGAGKYRRSRICGFEYLDRPLWVRGDIRGKKEKV